MRKILYYDKEFDEYIIPFKKHIGIVILHKRIHNKSNINIYDYNSIQTFANKEKMNHFLKKRQQITILINEIHFEVSIYFITSKRMNIFIKFIKFIIKNNISYKVKIYNI